MIVPCEEVSSTPGGEGQSCTMWHLLPPTFPLIEGDPLARYSSILLYLLQAEPFRPASVPRSRSWLLLRSSMHCTARPPAQQRNGNMEPQFSLQGGKRRFELLFIRDIPVGLRGFGRRLTRPEARLSAQRAVIPPAEQGSVRLPRHGSSGAALSITRTLAFG